MNNLCRNFCLYLFIKSMKNEIWNEHPSEYGKGSLMELCIQIQAAMQNFKQWILIFFRRSVRVQSVMDSWIFVLIKRTYCSFVGLKTIHQFIGFRGINLDIRNYNISPIPPVENQVMGRFEGRVDFCVHHLSRESQHGLDGSAGNARSLSSWCENDFL